MLLNPQIVSLVCKSGRILTLIRHFSVTQVDLRGTGLAKDKPLQIQRWREPRDIPACGQEYGPLTDLPDWRYPDGTPCALNRGQRNRLVRQEEYAQQITFLLKEVDSAVETHRRNLEEQEQKRQTIIQSKLKEKGKPAKFLEAPSSPYRRR